MGYFRHYSKWHNHKDPNYIKYIKRKYRKTFEDYLPTAKDAAILEVGCANGMALNALKDMGYTNLHGIEIDPELAQIARKISLKIINDDVLVFIKEAKNKFDFIYLFDVLEHFEISRIPEILRGLYQLLNDNGKLMMVIPNATSPSGSYFRYIDWTHHTSFTPTSISYLLEEAGFMDITISDESVIQEPLREEFEKIEHYSHAKRLSERARFYEAFARWEMTCMFGPSKYNLLIAPNMKIVACKKNHLNSVDLKIIVKNENLFDLQDLSNKVKNNKCCLEDLKNNLMIIQKDLNNKLNKFIENNSTFTCEIDRYTNRTNNKIVDIEEKIKHINNEIKKIYSLKICLDKFTRFSDDINIKIISIENDIKKHKEIINLQAFENIQLSEQFKENLIIIQKRLDNIILKLFRQAVLNKQKKVWHKIFLRLNAYKLRRLILTSGYFDKKYYLENYPDVKRNGMDPVLHYLNFGAYEGRNPSKLFNTNKYIMTNPEILIDSINPLVHMITHYGK